MRSRSLPPITPRASKTPKRLETNIETLADAANEAAKREAAQWFYFVTIMLTLAAIVGSTTHRVLFLEDPVKVPLLSVELPLRGFYVVAPAIFVVLHFYLLAQVRLMAGKVRAFLNEARKEAGKDDGEFEKALNRIDGFSIAQLIVADRLGRVAPAVRAMAWVTLVVAPVALLLFFQVRFLPFHSEWITGWHRVLVLVDLLLIWALWPSLESGPMTQAAVQFARLGGVAVVMFFSGLVATIPGERLDRAGGDLAVKRALFGGEIDHVSQTPRSLFSRRLVLPDEDFVPDSDQALAQVSRSRVLRGRDLRFAVLDRADLRGVDLTGADLSDASLRGTVLRRARLSGALLANARLDGADLSYTEIVCQRDDALCETFTSASLNDTKFVGALLVLENLSGLTLTGVDFSDAELVFVNAMETTFIRASFDRARLLYFIGAGATLRASSLRGTNLFGANLIAAELQSAQLHGANLSGASLIGADLSFASMPGANLASAHLQGAILSGADLSAAYMWRVGLEGARLDTPVIRAVQQAAQQQALPGPQFCPPGPGSGATRLTGAFMREAGLWRANAYGSSFHLADLAGAILARPRNWHVEMQQRLEQVPERSRALAEQRLNVLLRDAEDDRLTQELARTWTPGTTADRGYPCPLLRSDSEADMIALGGFLERAACIDDQDGFVARSLVWQMHGRQLRAYRLSRLAEFADVRERLGFLIRAHTPSLNFRQMEALANDAPLLPRQLGPARAAFGRRFASDATCSPLRHLDEQTRLARDTLSAVGR